MFVWIVLFTVFGVPPVLILLALAYFTGGRQRLRAVFLWMIETGFKTGVYFIVVAIVFVLFCVIRGVDPGIGDGFSVPLGSGWKLECIDTPESGFIHRDSLGSETIIRGISQIGDDGTFVFGLSEDEGHFLFDTESGNLTKDLALADLRERLAKAGVTFKGIMSTSQFYFAKRHMGLDLALLVVLGVPAVAFVIISFKRAWKGELEG